ncbi:hypothetical protein [Actimicrobium antarcticum]|uniref:Uncharacterized protein n=1 Tax=Actimicrobium antarcticum TaxID=1051899 RepID=A0ABP7TZ62_9BURK
MTRPNLNAPPEIDDNDEVEAEQEVRDQLEPDLERRGSLDKDDPSDLLDESDPVPPEGS